jgi:hypothetical protein
MGNTLKVVGWFFGILFILFGLLLVPGNAIGALIVMFIGVLMCYGGSRSGRATTPYVRGGPSNTQRIEDERTTRARQFWYWNTYINPNGPMHRRR